MAKECVKAKIASVESNCLVRVDSEQYAQKMRSLCWLQVGTARFYLTSYMAGLLIATRYSIPKQEIFMWSINQTYKEDCNLSLIQKREIQWRLLQHVINTEICRKVLIPMMPFNMAKQFWYRNIGQRFIRIRPYLWTALLYKWNANVILSNFIHH